MKFTTDRPYGDPEKAARKLIEIANSVEAVQDGRIHIEKVNWPFLQAGGSVDEYPMSSLGSPARHAASVAPTSAPIGLRPKPMREKGWSREFDEPIDLPRGRQLVTLEDAGNYITKLPKAEHTAPEWQDAMEALILVATRGGPTMLARIGVMTALNRKIDRVFNPDRKDAHWGKRKLKRDMD